MSFHVSEPLKSANSSHVEMVQMLEILSTQTISKNLIPISFQPPYTLMVLILLKGPRLFGHSHDELPASSGEGSALAMHNIPVRLSFAIFTLRLVLRTFR